MTIRRATTADLGTLRELWEEFERELPAPEYDRETWQEAEADIRASVDAGGAFLAGDEGRPVGFALSRSRTRQLGYLSDLYVRPAARRRGLARELVAHVAAAARERGNGWLELEVDPDNAVARGFYERLGFRTTILQQVAELALLEQRLGRAEAAPSFGSIHVQTDDEPSVERAVRHFLPRLGRSGGTTVSPPRNGWIAVYDELCDHDRKAQRRFAGELSDRLGAVTIALAVEEGRVVRMLAFERGRLVDEYLSVPEYYGPLAKVDELTLAANPTLLARLTGADAGRLRAVARTADTPGELPAAPELLAALAAELGLEGAGHGYADAEGVEIRHGPAADR